MAYTTSLLLAAAVAVAPTLAQTPPSFSPSTSETFDVVYNDGSITAGETIPVPDAALSPAVDISSVAGDDAHVLAFVDLDPPAAIGPLLHWLAALPSDVDTLTANDSSSASVAPYLGPNPPPGTGLHRYVFFLLNNPSDEFALPPGYGGLTNGTEARFNFSIDAFMEAGGFTLAAANYFTAENTTATNSTNSTQSPSATPSPSATAPPPDSGALGNVAGLQSAFALGGAFMALSYFL